MIANKTFAEIITFTRSSVARYFNNSGLMVQAAADEPRFEYDPITLVARGIKIEPARTNIMTFSQDFSNAVWVKATRTATLTTVAAPDGTTNSVYRLAGTGVAGASNLQRTTLSFVSGNTYSLSVFVKPETDSFIYLALPVGAFGVAQQVNFNLTGSGSFIVIAGTPSATITQLPNGWYRCSITATATANLTAAWVVYGFTQAVTTSVLLWGAQLEVGTEQSSYIPTTNASATRAQDIAHVAVTTPWLNSAQGTLALEFSDYAGANTSFYASLGTTSASVSRTAIWTNTNKIVAGQVIDNSGGTSFSQSIGSAIVRGQVVKAALSFKLNNFRMAVSGQLGAVDTSGILHDITRLSLGARGASTTPMNGYLRKVSYHPYFLDNDQLRALTL